MIGNVNCDKKHALELGQLFIENKINKNKICINLIPYNPTQIGDEHNFEAPTNDQLEAFKAVIIGQYGMFCTIRKSTTSGRGIYGACGQLALKGNHVQDIEDMMHSNSNKNIKKLRRKKKKTKTKNKTNDNFFNLNRPNARN